MSGTDYCIGGLSTSVRGGQVTTDFMETEADETTAQLALLETGECQVMVVIRQRDGDGRTFNEVNGGFFLLLY